MNTERHNLFFKRMRIPALTLALITSLLLGCSSSSSKRTTLLATESSRAAELILHDAIEAYDAGLYSISRERFAELEELHPFSPYLVISTLKTADAFFFSGKYSEALVSYQAFLTKFPKHEAESYVRLQLALCNLEQYAGPLKDQSPILDAEKALHDYLEKFPLGLHSLQVKKRLSEVHEFKIAHENTVADFYEKQGKTEAAEKRRKNLAQ